MDYHHSWLSGPSTSGNNNGDGYSFDVNKDPLKLLSHKSKCKFLFYKNHIKKRYKCYNFNNCLKQNFTNSRGCMFFYICNYALVFSK